MSLWSVDPVKPMLFHLPPPPEPPSIQTLQKRTKRNSKSRKSKQAKLLNGLSKPTASKSLSVIARPKNAMNLSTILHPKPAISVSTIAHPTQTSVRSLLALASFKPTKSVSAINSLPRPKLKPVRTLLALDTDSIKREPSKRLPIPLDSIKNEQLDNTIPSQSLGSPVYSPSGFPPRQPDFYYYSVKIGDIVLVDRTEIGDGLRKATIVHVNKEYCPDYEYFQGHLVVLKPSARERSRNCEGKQTVYYVHYARLDRRMDEWIDVHEIHSAVDSSTTPTFSQCGSSLILSDFNDPPAKNTRSQKKLKMMKISKI
uniref:Tudor-knot domain-containing protein n=1 Tax=Panagrolaimus davidi TaxID=227884 RepID=A0A914QAZ8_9BILA